MGALEFGKYTENLMYISSEYTDLKRKYEALYDIDDAKWCEMFVEWANEFEDLYGKVADFDGELGKGYTELICEFAKEKILEYAGVREKRMLVNQYKTLLGRDRIPVLLKERSYDYACDRLNSPEKIAKMIREVYEIHKQTEEFLYELCFDKRMKLIAVFEISHGCIDETSTSTREIFQKALMCGAATIVLVHNHPSGESDPSENDRRTDKEIYDAGKLLNIELTDSIIIGDDEYYSFREENQF